MPTVLSTNSVNALGVTDVVIPAPTGIEEGDMLVAVVGTGIADVSSVPSGWVSSNENSYDLGGLSSFIEFFYKVAVTADETATDYTFGTITNGGTGGAIFRVSGLPSAVDPLFDISDQNSRLEDTETISYTATVEKPAPALLIMAGSAEGADESSYSNYTLTDEDTNPIWTELIDVTTSTGSEPSFFCAYTVVTDITDITAWGYDVNTSSAGDDVALAVSLASFVEQTNGTADISHLNIDPTVESISGSNTDNASVSHLDTVLTVNPISSKSTSDGTQWINKAKPSDTWTNKSI